MKRNIVISIFVIALVGGIIAMRFLKHTPSIGMSSPIETIGDSAMQVKESDRGIVRAFFGNNIKDPNVLHCDRVYPVERVVPKTQAVARTALQELLMGLTPFEKQEGYFTAINDGVKIQKLTIENGTAFVDFDETLEAQVGGSCRVTIIRAQIKETLKQFPTVQNVVLTVNGRGEDIILQP